jgi:hypothetical protein
MPAEAPVIAMTRISEAYSYQLSAISSQLSAIGCQPELSARAVAQSASMQWLNALADR